MHQSDEKYVSGACIYLINQLNTELQTSIKQSQLLGDLNMIFTW